MEEMREMVVLTDADDVEMGVLEKLQAHRTGVMHRAFSIFLLNTAGELLLQRRAVGKYHSGGLWSNACCGHPRPGEDTLEAATRRMTEELGLTSELTHLFSFVYTAELDGGLVEHELDHVFVGWTDEVPNPDPEEVGDWRWMGVEQIRTWLEVEPEAFTAWFTPALERLLQPGTNSNRA